MPPTTDGCAYHEASSNNFSFRSVTRNEAVAKVFQLADDSRMQELGLGSLGLIWRADVAYGLQSMVIDCEPLGSVGYRRILCGVSEASGRVASGMSERAAKSVEELLHNGSSFSRSRKRALYDVP